MTPQLRYPDNLVEMNVFGYPAFVYPIDVPEIEKEIRSKNDWIHYFHVAAHKAVTEYGVAGDPVWDELIRLTDHRKGNPSAFI